MRMICAGPTSSLTTRISRMATPVSATSADRRINFLSCWLIAGIVSGTLVLAFFSLQQVSLEEIDVRDQHPIQDHIDERDESDRRGRGPDYPARQFRLRRRRLRLIHYFPMRREQAAA